MGTIQADEFYRYGVCVVDTVLIFIVGLIFLALLAVKLKPSTKGVVAFERTDYLFTPAERSFLGVLEQVLDSRYRVFGKVRLGDIVTPAKDLSRSSRTIALNKIRQKHVDFVICSAANLAVIGVIELDDKSHERKDRVERDLFVDQACASARIPLIRFEAQKGYRLEEVRSRLANAFTLPEVKTELIASKEEPVSSPSVEPIAEAAIEKVDPVCPKCESRMVKRQAKNGPHAGKWFWACSAFPKCRQVVATE